MRKVIYTHLVSADGFIETDESYQGENWASSDEELMTHFKDLEVSSDAHLYGRRVFLQLADWWPVADKTPGVAEYLSEYAELWRQKTKYVFSTTLDHADWNTEVVRTDAVQAVQELKSRTGKDMFLYGGVLSSTLMPYGLIDEFRLYVNPVFIGKGKPMLPHLNSLYRLKLLDTKVFTCGVVLLHYGCRFSGDTP